MSRRDPLTLGHDNTPGTWNKRLEGVKAPARAGRAGYIILDYRMETDVHVNTLRAQQRSVLVRVYLSCACIVPPRCCWCYMGTSFLVKWMICYRVVAFYLSQINHDSTAWGVTTAVVAASGLPSQQARRRDVAYFSPQEEGGRVFGMGRARQVPPALSLFRGSMPLDGENRSNPQTRVIR